jgi:hypothetical protein
MPLSRPGVFWVVGGGLVGVAITTIAAVRLASAYSQPVWAATPAFVSVAGGTLSGACCGFLVWALGRPRARLTTAGAILVSVNCAAWLLFLVATPRLRDGGTEIRDQRAQLDRADTPSWPHGTIIDIRDPPTLLAGRVVTWLTLPEKPLGLLAGPAIVFAHAHVVPARYWTTGATVRESYWIAGAGLLVSAAWWAAVASMVRVLRMKRRALAKDSVCCDP